MRSGRYSLEASMDFYFFIFCCRKFWVKVFTTLLNILKLDCNCNPNFLTTLWAGCVKDIITSVAVSIRINEVSWLNIEMFKEAGAIGNQLPPSLVSFFNKNKSYTLHETLLIIKMMMMLWKFIRLLCTTVQLYFYVAWLFWLFGSLTLVIKHNCECFVLLKLTKIN